MKRVKSLMLIMISAVLLAACGQSEGTSGSSNGEGKPIKIGFSALPSWYLWHLVEEKGFFEKHGVDVELVYFPVYADSLSALNTGEIDGNSQALIDTIAPLSRNIDIRAVFITDNSHGGDGLITTEEIQTLDDLRGKKIATEIGTIAHFFMLTALQEAGLSERDVNFTNMVVQDAGTTFIAGNLDAASLWEPFLSIAEEQGSGQKLITSAEFPGLIADVLAMRQEVLEEREEDVSKIVAAWFDAVDYFHENEEEAIQIIAEAAEIQTSELAIGMDGFRLFSPEETLAAYSYEESYKSLIYTAERNAEFLYDLEFIREIPSFDNLIAPSFIEKELERRN
ncbi:aliphatic sulfonate ABC transporter substrate-binding protein [Anaerobacillus arseniciselenatis]|uniref:Aliphatic sulfonate ABC transporter substrate-binding protein n=1 Tax=Anaerobacillus arseniciselenatis TaxID=85682 RepID=A0A1S2LP17_9BACI|nr:ABC transporter substrate-binding protein [Anaerobacillus arseniciselenatis]OIJ14094.1 aliphatic sulfonate ABC transporter substrate-binding protein [Anaerobacillus arseniciselenatis]